MRVPDHFFKIVSPLQENVGAHFRYTVAVLREDSIALYTRVKTTKRASASRARNWEARNGIRVATWKEFRRVLEEIGARMHLDMSPLCELDITALKGNVYLREG